MNDEQIKVLEAFAERTWTAGQMSHSENDALTAALEYIKDMREIEAAAEEVIFDEKINCRVYRLRKWHIWGLDRATHCYDSLHEAFKSVKGGKE